MTPIAEIWRGNAARLHRGVCGDCGQFVLVARQERSRKFQCLECFTAKPTGTALLCRVVRKARSQAVTR